MQYPSVRGSAWRKPVSRRPSRCASSTVGKGGNKPGLDASSLYDRAETSPLLGVLAVLTLERPSLGCVCTLAGLLCLSCECGTPVCLKNNSAHSFKSRNPCSSAEALAPCGRVFRRWQRLLHSRPKTGQVHGEYVEAIGRRPCSLRLRTEGYFLPASPAVRSVLIPGCNTRLSQRGRVAAVCWSIAYAWAHSQKIRVHVRLFRYCSLTGTLMKLSRSKNQ